jgi:hypothetical protein
MQASSMKDRIRLIKLHWEFLKRNEKFVKELEIWQSNYLDSKELIDRRYAADVSFRRRWGISPIKPELDEDEIEDILSEHAFPDPWASENLPVSFQGWDILASDDEHFDEEYAEARISVSVDLRYPKKTIMNEFERLLDLHKADFPSNYRKNLFYAFCWKNFGRRPNRNGELNPRNPELEEQIRTEFEQFYLEKEKDLRMPTPGKRRLQTIEQYEIYLRVWDLRAKEGRSWSYIQKELSLNALQTARDYYKAACKVIEEGIPGLPPFPWK